MAEGNILTLDPTQSSYYTPPASNPSAPILTLNPTQSSYYTPTPTYAPTYVPPPTVQQTHVQPPQTNYFTQQPSAPAWQSPSAFVQPGSYAPSAIADPAAFDMFGFPTPQAQARQEAPAAPDTPAANAGIRVASAADMPQLIVLFV